MSKKRANFCQYIPDFNGSPAWMSVEEAEERLKKANEYLDQMIELCAEDPRAKAL